MPKTPLTGSLWCIKLTALDHPNSALITGVVCGVRVEEIADPLMQKFAIWIN